MQKKCRFRKILRKVVWFYALMMLSGISRLLEKNANRHKSSSVPTADVDFKSAQTQTK